MESEMLELGGGGAMEVSRIFSTPHCYKYS